MLFSIDVTMCNSSFHVLINLFLIDLARSFFYKKNIDIRCRIEEFEPRLKYGWFLLKLYSMFQDLWWCSIETGFWRI